MKQDLHQLIDKCDNESVLEEAKILLQEQDRQADWWDDLTEEDQSRVMESEAQYRKGDFIPYSELRQQYEAKKKK